MTPMRAPAQLVRAFREIRDRLAAVAPRRVHLQIAAVGPRRDDRRRQRRVEREPQRVPAQVRAPEPAPLLDLAFLGGRVDRGVHCGRSAGPHQFRHDPLAGRADERNVAERALLDQIDDRAIDPGGQRLRGPLVAERAALRALQDREIVQQSRRDDVAIAP